MPDTIDKVEQFGFDVIQAFLTEQSVAEMIALLDATHVLPGKGGVREIDKLIPELALFANSDLMLKTAAKYLSGRPCLVRAIYFNKNTQNNWLVTWHQDKTVAVSNKLDLEGWGPWTLKAGVHHVQPPIEVLEQTITIRLHLDKTTKENGCLKVIQGSHRFGLLATADIIDKINSLEQVYCEVNAGDAVVMRPHIVHSSEKGKKVENRRILHFEYSSYDLPKGVSWVA